MNDENASEAGSATCLERNAERLQARRLILPRHPRFQPQPLIYGTKTKMRNGTDFPCRSVRRKQRQAVAAAALVTGAEAPSARESCGTALRHQSVFRRRARCAPGISRGSVVVRWRLPAAVATEVRICRTR